MKNVADIKEREREREKGEKMYWTIQVLYAYHSIDDGIAWHNIYLLYMASLSYLSTKLLYKNQVQIWSMSMCVRVVVDSLGYILPC